VRLPPSSLSSLSLSHVLSSHLRTWKGPHSRRLPRPRPRLLWRRRLHLLSLLYCYSSREHKPHRRQITTVHQRHLVVHLVYLWDHRAAFHCSISGRKVPRLPSTRKFPSFSFPHIITSAPMHRRTNSYISPCKRPYPSPWKRKAPQSSNKLWVPASTSQSSEITTSTRNRTRHVSLLRSRKRLRD
jgi:hypothetical protein